MRQAVIRGVNGTAPGRKVSGAPVHRYWPLWTAIEDSWIKFGQLPEQVLQLVIVVSLRQ